MGQKNTLIKVKQCISLLLWYRHVLVISKIIFLKYKFLILHTYHAETVYLFEQECEEL